VKSAPPRPLTIGLVARRAGVGVETVRFYERQGLIEEPPRRLSGYREYDDEVVTRLGFIRRAKELGFTLKEIKELLSLRRDPSTPAADVKRRAKAKITDIDAKIATLQTMKKALERLTSACRGHATSAGCPLLHALEHEEGRPCPMRSQDDEGLCR
jgi:MerR family mercuric resistance operon transcriptional regulator